MSGGRAGAGLAAVTLTLLAGASLLRPGPLPRLGPLLDPVRGIWSVAREAELPARATGAIPGLTAPVTVRYDDRAVPHIFAANELDATRALRKLPAHADTPVIALSANVFAEDKARCFDTGMNDFVAKPCDSESLYATLLHWLDRVAEPPLRP